MEKNLNITNSRYSGQILSVRGKKDSLISLFISIEFFQIVVYLTLFVLKRYLVSDFIASNY